MSRIEYEVDITSVVMRMVDGVLAPLAKGVRP
jgi:hypothetical protein